jgi:hypothetical protein
MFGTLARRVCRIIVKKSRPTTGNGRPLIAATGYARRGDLSGPVLFGAGEKSGPHRSTNKTIPYRFVSVNGKTFVPRGQTGSLTEMSAGRAAPLGGFGRVF